MAHQIPVVASDIPGNRQLVTHGRTGRLVPVADVTALGNAIISSVQDDDSAAMAAAAYSDVKNKYSIRQTAQSHLSLLSGDGV